MSDFHRDEVSGQGRAVSVGEASEMLGVSAQTVRNWIQAGVLKASRTFGNHRRVCVRSIRRWNGEDEEPQEERLTVCYSRVSTQAQKKEGGPYRPGSIQATSNHRTSNLIPALHCSRLINFSPIAVAGVQIPPGQSRSSLARQSAASPSILEVAP